MTRLLPLFILLAWECRGQNEKEMIRSLQRDVSQLQEATRLLNSKFDEKLAVLTTLVQQALEEAKGANRTALATDSRLRDSLREQQAFLKEQQNAVASPLAVLGPKVEQLEQAIAASTESAHDSNQRLMKLQAIVADILTAVTTLNKPPPKPEGDGPPAGIPSNDVYDAALRDRQGGNLDLAFQGFQNFVRWYPNSPLAPAAQYYIGDIFYNKGDNDNAIAAFDAALEQYPDSKLNPDVLYMKGMALVKAEKKTQASQLFLEVTKKYPNSDAAAKAKEMRSKLGITGRPAGK